MVMLLRRRDKKCMIAIKKAYLSEASATQSSAYVVNYTSEANFIILLRGWVERH